MAVIESGGMYKATVDYTAEKDDELSYKKGDVMEILTKSLTGWWQAL